MSNFTKCKKKKFAQIRNWNCGPKKDRFLYDVNDGNLFAGCIFGNSFSTFGYSMFSQFTR